MTGSCDRMWARVALKPKSEPDKASSKQTGNTKTAATKPGAGETNAEIRKVWMFGNVALHQDPKKDKRNKTSRTLRTTKGRTRLVKLSTWIIAALTRRLPTSISATRPKRHTYRVRCRLPALRVSKIMTSRRSQPPAVSR